MVSDADDRVADPQGSADRSLEATPVPSKTSTKAARVQPPPIAPKRRKKKSKKSKKSKKRSRRYSTSESSTTSSSDEYDPCYKGYEPCTFDAEQSDAIEANLKLLAEMEAKNL